MNKNIHDNNTGYLEIIKFAVFTVYNLLIKVVIIFSTRKYLEKPCSTWLRAILPEFEPQFNSY